jgi:hypothetical protein
MLPTALHAMASALGSLKPRIMAAPWATGSSGDAFTPGEAKPRAWTVPWLASAAVGAIHQAAVADFNTMFWSEATSSYYDWVDSSGAPRNYFYVDIAFTAIIANVANATQASALLQHYDTRLADIESSLGVQAGNIW